MYSPIQELEQLTQKIEFNTATLPDYQRYEELLLQSGLPRNYIYSYLRRAGFNSWEDFVAARRSKERRQMISGAIIGGLVGLGLGVLFYDLLVEEGEEQ